MENSFVSCLPLLTLPRYMLDERPQLWHRGKQMKMPFSYPPRVVFVSIVFFVLTACAVATPTPAPTPLVALDPATVAWAGGPGTATVEGQAFLKTVGGDVKYGAGNTVYLIPNVPHTFDWFTRVTADMSTAPEINPAVNKVTRKTLASGDGRFKFENVPAGSYIVVTTVQWGAPVGYHGAMRAQGGFVGTVVTAESGKTVTAIATR